MSDPDALLKAADEALYAAKEAGRNQTCTASQTRGGSSPMSRESVHGELVGGAHHP